MPPLHSLAQPVHWLNFHPVSESRGGWRTCRLHDDGSHHFVWWTLLLSMSSARRARLFASTSCPRLATLA